MRSRLALATVRFNAFPRVDFAALRALPRCVTRFLSFLQLSHDRSLAVLFTPLFWAFIRAH